jgi:hypothetical protein
MHKLDFEIINQRVSGRMAELLKMLSVWALYWALLINLIAAFCLHERSFNPLTYGALWNETLCI